MLKLQLLMEGRYDYGCVMGRVDEETSHKILEFNQHMIGEDILYTEEDLGREYTPHVTIKWGLTESYSQHQMREFLKEVRPFMLELRGIGIFENERFDVVKFNVEGKELRALNEKFSKLPNQDSHPIYKPHITLAYVNKGMGKKFVREAKQFARVPVNSIEYSDRGIKSCYNLDEGLGIRNYDAEIDALRKEWDRLDHMGNQETNQQEISLKIQKLQKEKEKWDKLYRAAL